MCCHISGLLYRNLRSARGAAHVQYLSLTQ
jgi:hypothetical protein